MGQVLDVQAVSGALPQTLLPRSRTAALEHSGVATLQHPNQTRTKCPLETIDGARVLKLLENLALELTVGQPGGLAPCRSNRCALATRWGSLELLRWEGRAYRTRGGRRSRTIRRTRALLSRAVPTAARGAGRCAWRTLTGRRPRVVVIFKRSPRQPVGDLKCLDWAPLTLASRHGARHS